MAAPPIQLPSVTQTAHHLAADPALILPFLLSNAEHILGAIAILVAGVWVAGKTDALLVRALARSRHFDEMLRGFFGSIARYFILVITLLAVLSEFGIQTTSLVAVIGAASLAIGLALQGTLTNLAAGVMLLIFRLFRVGHHIQVAGIDGTVRELSLFWTEIVTADNVQVIIPNASVWGQALRNFSTYPAPVATATLRLPVPAGMDLAEGQGILLALAKAHPKVRQTPAPGVLLERAGDALALAYVVTFAPDGDVAGGVKSDLIKSALTAFGRKAAPGQEGA